MCHISHKRGDVRSCELSSCELEEQLLFFMLLSLLNKTELLGHGLGSEPVGADPKGMKCCFLCQQWVVGGGVYFILFYFFPWCLVPTCSCQYRITFFPMEIRGPSSICFVLFCFLWPSSCPSVICYSNQERYTRESQWASWQNAQMTSESFTSPPPPPAPPHHHSPLAPRFSPSHCAAKLTQRRHSFSLHFVNIHEPSRLY